MFTIILSRGGAEKGNDIIEFTPQDADVEQARREQPAPLLARSMGFNIEQHPQERPGRRYGSFSSTRLTP